MEAERLRHADQILHHARHQARGALLGQRAAQHVQVLEELLLVRVCVLLGVAAVDLVDVVRDVDQHGGPAGVVEDLVVALELVVHQAQILRRTNRASGGDPANQSRVGRRRGGPIA
eukprot:4834984-Pyramimonas_sp.AAC.1